MAATGTAAAATTRHGMSFDAEYHAVDDLGMDPDGNSTVNAEIEQAFSDNALVRMPPGEYLIDPAVIVGGGRAGFLGTGSSRNDARFTVPSGSAGATLAFDGASGGLFENVSFDQGTDWDKLMSFVMRGGDWQYHSVELMGTEPNAGAMGDGVTSFLQTDATPGTSLLVDDLQKVGPADIRDYPDGRNVVITGHNTDVTIRNSDIRNSTNGSGLYLNNTSGQIVVENNYFENCCHTAIRVNGSNATVRNNAVVIDPFGEYGNPDNRWQATSYDNGQEPMRAIWVYDPEDWTSGDAVLENNHVLHATGSAIGGIVIDDSADGATIRSCRVKSEDGCSHVSAASPATIENAEHTGLGSIGGSGSVSDSNVVSDVSISLSTSNVSRSGASEPDIVQGEPPGNDSGGSDTESDLENTLTIQGTGTSANYAFTVSGDLEENASDGSLEEWDEISGSSANGWVTETSHLDSFKFSGEVTDFEFLEGSATVYLNGDEVDLGSGSKPAIETLSISEVETDNSDAAFDVDWGVSDADGDLATVDLTLTNADASETVDSTSLDVSGDAASDATRLTAPGADGSGANFVVELRAVDSRGASRSTTETIVEDEPPLPNTLTIEGAGTPANYEFTVSDELQENESEGPLEEWDDISGTTANGWVTDPGQLDSFKFSGEIVEFDFLEGVADVYLNGEQVYLGQNKPSVDALSVSEVETDSDDAAFDVEWGVSDEDGDLATVDLALANADAGETVDSASVDVGGSSASDTTRLAAPGADGSGANFVVELRVTDGTGAASSDTATVTESEPKTSNTLTIQGTGTPANYDFTVSGELSENESEGSLEEWDDLSGSSANGWVTETSHVDGFEFTGEVTEFQFLEGSATVYLNGDEVDLTSRF